MNAVGQTPWEIPLEAIFLLPLIARCQSCVPLPAQQPYSWSMSAGQRVGEGLIGDLHFYMQGLRNCTPPALTDHAAA